MNNKKTNQLPTKPKIDSLLLKPNLIHNCYTSRVLVANGIGLIMCGLAFFFWGIVAFFLESSMESFYFGIWIGLIVLVSGFVSIASGKHNLILILLNVNFFISIFTTAAIAFVTILAATATLKNQNLIINFYTSRQSLESDKIHKPNITINFLVFIIPSLTCIFSFINLAFSAKAVLRFYSKKGLRFCDAFHQNKLDSIKRRDRIISWIIQQSNEFQFPSNLNRSSLKLKHKLINNYI